jgi:hypothetical protein
MVFGEGGRGWGQRGPTSFRCKGPRSIAVSAGVTMSRAPGTGIWKDIDVVKEQACRSRGLV